VYPCFVRGLSADSVRIRAQARNARRGSLPTPQKADMMDRLLVGVIQLDGPMNAKIFVGRVYQATQ
jgi:hypothetical protein